MNASVVAIDCFSGAGGLSLGMSQAGIEVRYAFDSDQAAVDTYSANLGGHAQCISVNDVAGPIIRKRLASEGCDLVFGGPPCQGFSVQRRGEATDSRNELIFEFLRIVVEAQPKIFLMENVAALAGPRGKAYLEKFQEKAEAAGYIISWEILNASDFGVPQNRKRLFVVGERSDLPITFSFPASQQSKKTVRDAIGDLPNPLDKHGIPNHQPDNISSANRERISHVPQGGGREDIPMHLRLPCHRVSVSKAGHRGVYGRLHWDQPAGTITTKCNSFTRGRFAHPVENRNITMREAARIQGFPDDFVFLGNKVSVAHQVGNAVPPPLAKELGLALRNALELKNNALSRSPLGPTDKEREYDRASLELEIESQG